MKKTILGTIFGTLLLTAILSMFICCKIALKEEEQLPKPDVSSDSAAVTISIPLYEKTPDYINIFRKDTSSNTTTNIGILYPSAMGSVSNAYIFYDELIVTNHKYEYMARYHVDGEYYSSAWSNEITPQCGYDNESMLSYAASDLYFSYVKDNNGELYLDGTIEKPQITNYDDDYKLMIIISNSSKTQVFELPENPNKTPLPLGSGLPLEFLDTDITFEGIVGQKTVLEDPKKEDSEVKYICWTMPTKLKKVTVKIESPSKRKGMDYSRSALNPDSNSGLDY